MNIKPTILCVALAAAAALTSACSKSEVASATTGAAGVAAAMVASNPASAVSPVVPAASAAEPVPLSSSFAALSPEPSASNTAPATPDEQLLTVAMRAGINSSLAPMSVELFEDSYDKWASLARGVLAGKPASDFEKLSTSTWTKSLTYLQIDKRTVFFAALVEFQGRDDAMKTRRVMPVVVQVSDNGTMAVASVDGIPGLSRADRFLQSFPSAPTPVDLSGADFTRMRANIAKALKA